MSNRKLYDGDDFDDRPPSERGPRPDVDGRLRDVRTSAQEAVHRASSRGRKRSSFSFSKLMNKPAVLAGVLIAGVGILALVVYLLTNRSTQPAAQPSATQTAARQAPASTDAGARPTQAPATEKRDDGGISQIFNPQPAAPAQSEPEGWLATGARIILRLALAALLTAMLAFRPRKDMPILQRNPYVAQTQILLAVVASALMMIVADNAARAFGIFAAASLVRFRTNIRDPKEITILLVSLGIGLATGVGRMELAIILSLFVLLMLWVLEYYEPAQVFRAMELTVTTRNVDETDEVLREIFDRHNFTTELRKVNREDDNDPLGKIVYYVNVRPDVSTDQLSEEVFAADPENIDSIQWDQKKSNSYIYR